MNDYDVVVIGSGFGGSVAALRLSEKGYRVGVIEAGRWFRDDELPQTSWRLRRYLWLPAARCFGIMRMTLLRNVLVVSGTGVGGGSLVYANTLYEPLDDFYRDPQWGHITDWKDELAVHYDQAKRMLGVTAARDTTLADDLMRTVAAEYGVSETLHAAQIGVYFGDGPGVETPDPYFGGVGPARTGCTECGACMTGCRVGAKNTTTKNYLPLAQRAGATVHAMTTVTDVRPIAAGRYRVRAHVTGNPLRRRDFTASHVVFACNALNTQRLLHRLKERSLPRLSARLGELSRTNSEAVLSARTTAPDADMTHGTAITSSFHPDPQTHVEPVRYGRGSSLLALLNAHLVDPIPGLPRWRAALRTYRRLGWRAAGRMHGVPRWAEQSLIVLVMQSLDNSLTTSLRRGMLGRRLTTRQGRGDPNPEWIPTAHRVARDLAQRIDGLAGGSSADLIGIPMTAHFIGGCVIGTSITEGVIDPYQRVFGYDGLHIADGSAVSANLGVNPSLTITAQAERAMSFWPNKGDADTRPPMGATYQRVDAVAPRHPVVPASAPGALRLPMPAVRRAAPTRKAPRP
ncbi:GMC family oxidoreductase [Microbacterium sp. Sa4CUA7]|uniref:Cholesterol oxidase n=1 Tax=Microbacterium pullorum TaxID=2762236 RepID=A0ABR8S3T9_9MICO|nr:GMC family oxidoreductase [Microbacterium pullorum]MBD7958115.1 GMC family oxidoreductase [Microbacterium pullorum]